MATLAQMASSVRQPFGVLDSSRLRNLSNVKNRQNAQAPSPNQSLKRRYVASEGSDAENVAPSAMKSAAKRKRTEDDDNLKPTKYAQYSLQTITSKSGPLTVSARIDTPRVSINNKNATPASAPSAAGRSPKSKRVGILSRRRTGSVSMKRVDPPTFSRGHGTRAPLSLAAALSGTVPSYKPKKVATLEEAMPKSWIFDIYEDTPEELESNLMLHSACTLDISDDESKVAQRDSRGKENVDPLDAPDSATTATAPPVKVLRASRKDLMTDEPRTPLGDLNTTDYYAEGCDASSVIIVLADGPEKTSSLENIQASSDDLAAASVSTFRDVSTHPLEKSELDALIRDTAPSVETILAEREKSKPQEVIASDTEIEIWESGSAADEAAQAEQVESIFAV